MQPAPDDGFDLVGQPGPSDVGFCISARFPVLSVRLLLVSILHDSHALAQLSLPLPAL